jgi:hypothetical protein
MYKFSQVAKGLPYNLFQNIKTVLHDTIFLNKLQIINYRVKAFKKEILELSHE